MRRNKVCLVFPRIRYISGDPPVGLSYLASYLEKNTEVDVTIIDMTFTRSFKIVYDKLCKCKPDILGIYADSMMINGALAIAEFAKKNNIYTVIGGPQPTVAPDSFIEKVDIVVRGEGELILSEIIRNYGSKDLSHIAGIWWKKKGNEIIKNSQNNNFVELDSLPFPQRGLLPMDKYLYYWNYLDAVAPNKRGTTMMVSRGCPFSCTYCQPTIREMFGERIRFRSPQNVCEEIKFLKAEYGIEGIFFHDDNFTTDYSWLTSFCQVLENEKLSMVWGCNSRVDTITEDILLRMYQVGLRNIHFGIESGSQRILDEIYNKKITLEQVKKAVALTKKIGIHAMGFFMLGAPYETEKDINHTIWFAKNLRLEEASFSLTTPLAGTHIYNMIMGNNKYKINYNREGLNYYSFYSIKGGIGQNRIKFLKFKAFLLFYLHPFRRNYIVKHFFSIIGIRRLLNKIRRVF